MASCSSLEPDKLLAKHCLPYRSALRRIGSIFLDASLTIGTQAVRETSIHTIFRKKKRLHNLLGEGSHQAVLTKTQRGWNPGNWFRSTPVRKRLLRGLGATALQPVVTAALFAQTEEREQRIRFRHGLLSFHTTGNGKAIVVKV